MSRWLFRPFTRLAGAGSLAAGVAAIVATALAGWWAGGVYTDGVLDLHLGPPAPLLLFLLHGGIAWLTLTLLLLAVGHWLTSTQYRVIDLLGTQALARWPLLPVVLLSGLPSYRRALQDAALAQGVTAQPAMADLATLLLLSLPALVAIVWMVWLMYHSYALVFHLKGARGAVSFALTLIAAELLSKLLIVALATP